jgi:glycine/D-amino acid oxidase-like deaminating enzyme
VTVLDRAASPASETTARSSLGFRQYASTPTEAWLKRYGKRFYHEVLESGDARYEPTDVLHLATTEAGAEAVDATAAGEAAGSSPSERLDGDELREVVMAPGLRTEDVRAALYRANAGYFRAAGPLVSSVLDLATRAGATVETDTPVTDLVVKDGRVTGLVAGGDRRAAGAVVLAAGPWNRSLAALADVDLPVRQQLMSVFDHEPARRFARPPPKVRHIGTGVVFRGRPNGRVLSYHSEPAADAYAKSEALDPATGPSDPPTAVERQILDSAATLLPAVADGSVVDTDVAFPSRTPDGYPIVGWTARPGLSVAATHSHGIQYAPGIGHVVAKQVVGSEPTDHYDALSISRFDGHADCR